MFYVCSSPLGSSGDAFRTNPYYDGGIVSALVGEIKPYSGFLKEGRLDLVYYRNPELNVGDPFPLWILQ
jgi:hypothetical protein